MTSVFLEFVPPMREGFVKLHIYESASLTDPLTLIETVEDIGTYPNYISSYSTDQATSRDDYFAIQWEDDKEVLTDVSTRVKGRTETLPGQVMDRVRQRDSTLDAGVVAQEAESAIEMVFNKDPYSVDLSVDVAEGRRYRTLNGLVYMVLARSLLASIVQSSATSQATMGLVSFQSSTSTNRVKDVADLIDMANRELGINQSVVIDMERICKSYGGRRWSQIYQYIDQEFRYIPQPIEIP